MRRELEDTNEMFSVYAVWYDLLPLATEAHREGNDELLRRIYGYAEWCTRQGGDLGNAAAVTFYEHLFDEEWMRPLVVSWLTGPVIHDVRPLWEARLSSEEMKEVDKLLRARVGRRDADGAHIDRARAREWIESRPSRASSETTDAATQPSR